MLKKTMTYTDCNGNQRTEDFYFNLTKAEIAEMEMSTAGGMAEMIQKIVDTQDGPAIIKIFKDLVLKSYGEKSADGKSFIKIKNGTIVFSNNIIKDKFVNINRIFHKHIFLICCPLFPM